MVSGTHLFPEELFQFRTDILIPEPVRGPFSDDDENILGIGHLLLIQTEKLPEEPLHPISLDRFPYFPADRQTESSESQRILAHKDDEVLRVVSCSGLKRLVEFLSLPDFLLLP